jgi:hypothetical protein
MQAHCPEAFDREMGCTEAELLQWLPGATRGRPVETSAGQARVSIDAGHLMLVWHTLAPRRIALMQIPRLAVAFRFSGVDGLARQEFMRYFDLYTQRGGG